MYFQDMEFIFLSMHTLTQNIKREVESPSNLFSTYPCDHADQKNQKHCCFKMAVYQALQLVKIGILRNVCSFFNSNRAGKFKSADFVVILVPLRQRDI